MLRVMVVDDEPLARDELIYLLKRTKQTEIVGEADCLDHAISALENTEVDVIFIDIQLADQTGLDLARRINEMEGAPKIVFATAYDHYALEAFNLNAVDYLLKPFEEERVVQTIDKLLLTKEKNRPVDHVRTNISIRPDKLAIYVEERIVMVAIKDISYLFTSNGLTMMVTEQATYKLSEPLVFFERKLQSHSFIRVHRAYLVNVNCIMEIEPWFNSTYNLFMKDGEKVPVSRTYVKMLKDVIGF